VTRPPRREAEPFETDERIPIGIGIGCFVIALAVLLILRNDLPEAHRWWMWTCVAGIAGGAFGMWYIPHLKRKRGIGG
jgi:ABC-type enterobactin transport system permease subunit